MFGVPRRVWQMLIGKSCRDLVWAIVEMEVKAGSVVVFVAVGNHGQRWGWIGMARGALKQSRLARTHIHEQLRALAMAAGLGRVRKSIISNDSELKNSC